MAIMYNKAKERDFGSFNEPKLSKTVRFKFWNERQTSEFCDVTGREADLSQICDYKSKLFVPWFKSQRFWLLIKTLTQESQSTSKINK